MNLWLSSRMFVCRLCFFIFPWQASCSCMYWCHCGQLGLLVRGTSGKSGLLALGKGWLIKSSAGWLSHFGLDSCWAWRGLKTRKKKKTNLPLPGSDANLRRSKFDSLNKGSSVLRFSKKLSSVHWCFVFLVGVQYFGDSFCILGKEWECTIQKQNISECDTGTLAK